MRREREAVETSSGRGAHQAQEPRRPSKVPGGTGGIAGSPEQKAPEQGGRDGDAGTGSDGPARSRIKGSINEARDLRSSLEATGCEQPALATDGASAMTARSVTTATAGEGRRCQGKRNLIIRRVSYDGPPFRSGQGEVSVK